MNDNKLKKHIEHLDNFLDVLKEAAFIRIDVFNKFGSKEAPVHLNVDTPMFAEVIEVLRKGLLTHREGCEQRMEMTNE